MEGLGLERAEGGELEPAAAGEHRAVGVHVDVEPREVAGAVVMALRRDGEQELAVLVVQVLGDRERAPGLQLVRPRRSARCRRPRPSASRRVTASGPPRLLGDRHGAS